MTNIPVKLPTSIRSIYDTLKRDLVVDIGGSKVITQHIATQIMKLRQIAGGAVLNEGVITNLHSKKIDELKLLIESFQGAPTLVGYHFKNDLKVLTEAFGDLPSLKDPETIAQWNKGNIPILPISPNASAHGLNLQFGGNKIVFYSLDWDAEKYQQTISRLRRLGQTKPVFVYHLLVDNTIDAIILKMLNSKERSQSEFIKLLK